MRHIFGAMVFGFALLSVAGGCQKATSDAAVGQMASPGSGPVTQDNHSFFPIVGGPHGNASCNQCHGGFDSFRQFSCVGCHEHDQALVTPQHAGVADFAFDSQACLKCHPNGVAGSVSRADHSTKFFPIDVASKHGAGQCTDCHTAPADKKQFTCVSCHDHAQAATDSKHVNIAGYAYDSASCLKCHPTGAGGTISRPDHTKFFPIDTGTAHAANQCAECHTDPADKKQFTCVSCHEHAQAVLDPKHANVASYKYDSPSCLACHANGKAQFDHTTLGKVPNCIGCHQAALAKAVTTPASQHNANKFPSECQLCHTSFTAWGPGTAMQHAAVGGTAAVCETCHMANFSASVTPFNHTAQGVLAAKCNACHRDVTSWTKYSHSSNCFNGATLRGHQGAKCAQCHANPKDYTVSSCTACHGNRGTNCND